MEDEKTSYTVTAEGGERPMVANRRRRVGEEIRLTADEAKWELSRGIIVETPRAAAPAAESPPPAPAARRRGRAKKAA